ncbi:polysaccharide biosynthesis/export family protein [Tellurirhabdus rosea]|uniref:polysaccharide biosynthesis/export family protein n=1 Tax=Tellurirhabdus rosea TaxID=2674997 RepID=UPI00224D89BE|nr:polysaccharide biosynthesis/export family protein [Tellurirhabdus rosea]
MRNAPLPVKYPLYGGLALLLCLLQSCLSSRELSYFQKGPTAGDTITVQAPYTILLKEGDLLSVQVNSLNPEASSFFNPYAAIASVERSAGVAQNNAVIQPQSGYVVSADGTISLPLAGKVAVRGTSLAQAEELVRTALLKYLKEPTVSIRYLNFRISVMGEVARPSLFTIPNDKITLPEALALAGDLTVFGRRQSVLVIRELNGQRTFNRIDLTNRDAFKSPFYYLQPNDVVYVEPGKARVASVDRMYQLVPAALSALSFLAIIIRRY